MSSVSGVIQALDMVIKLTDMASAAQIGSQEYKEAVENINTKLKRARDEGRDLSWDEVEESQGNLDSAIARARQMQGE